MVREPIVPKDVGEAPGAIANLGRIQLAHGGQFIGTRLGLLAVLTRFPHDAKLMDMTAASSQKTAGKGRGKLSTNDDLPKLSELHKSHFGLTKEVARCFAQAADVCLDRHHTSPVGLSIKTDGRSIQRRHAWRRPTARIKAAWANRDDATRDGAYAVCIASVQVAEGLYAVGRTETRTGADYYLGKTKNATDLERAFRLEVSGTDAGETEALTRLKQKKQQTKDGASDVPAFAAVVSFRDHVVLYANGES